ncbi:CotH kinase family protein [Acidobacterium sp. S8]|uniref:CotH kinase family protein n=1 Tax=Acidobacterium sp. S8 TaxID=1641854 RepID=UPI00131B5980|nr:CotH kinase family protein [Acidobacterium sp. S8]
MIVARRREILGSIALVFTALICGCGVHTNQLDLSPSVGSVTLTPGSSANVDVTAAADVSGTISITVSGLPPGVTVSPSPLQVAAGSTGTLTFKAAMNAAADAFPATGPANTDYATYTVTISGALQAVRNSSNLQLTVSLENPSFVPTTMNLPVVRITTQDNAPILNKTDYVQGNVTITPGTADPADSPYTGPMEAHLHGNSTIEMPKKPYKVKLNSKAPLLGMPSNKNWILLANYDDKALMRNYVALELSQRLSMPWTPSSVFVELFVNDQYEGNYQLTQEVDIGKTQVNITEMDDTDNSGKALTGGYLLEIDQHQDEDFVFTTPHGVEFGLQDPDPATSEQSSYIQSYVQEAEDSLYSGNFTDSTTGWRSYFDQNTLINWYLTNEIMGNVDADFYSSDYVYKDKNNPLLYMGPVWDFDISSGNVNYAPIVSPDIWWVGTDAAWYSRLFQDPKFTDAVIARWKQVKASQLDTLPAFIDQTAANLNQSQQNNFQRWPILGVAVWPNSEVAGSYQGEVDFLKSWLTQRIAWMDSQFSQGIGPTGSGSGPGSDSGSGSGLGSTSSTAVKH